MKGALTLLANSLKRVRFLVLTMGALLAGFQYLLTLVAASIERTRGFDDLTAIVPDLHATANGSFPCWIDVFCWNCLSRILPPCGHGLLVGLMIALATEPASEIETGFMDLILSRPLARVWVIGRSIAILIISTVFVLAMMSIGTWAGLRWLRRKESRVRHLNSFDRS